METGNKTKDQGQHGARHRDPENLGTGQTVAGHKTKGAVIQTDETIGAGSMQSD